jgi:hypothetical protein
MAVVGEILNFLKQIATARTDWYKKKWPGKIAGPFLFINTYKTYLKFALI